MKSLPFYLISDPPRILCLLFLLRIIANNNPEKNARKIVGDCQMNVNIPEKIFLTKGVGTHKERLASFESALRDAAAIMI